ncbi:hypothetical protein CAP39_09090 [Sphingomonas sp. IBVSS1]|nr:hypothetical protein CAP39_09090 [Sphingomonas sp. IBVSS1]
MAVSEEKLWQRWDRADAIRNRRANGRWLPILWHLALRGHGLSLLQLADWYTFHGEHPGRMQDRFSPAGMMRHALRRQERFAGLHLALTCFNLGDLGGYRHWLARAARAGDTEAAAERRRFEIRKPHRLAFVQRRGRKSRKTD